MSRFVSPRPVFKPTTNPSAIEAMTPKPKDTTPAPAVIQLLRNQGKIDLAAVVKQAQDQARQQTLVRLPRKGKQLPSPLPSPTAVAKERGQPQFQPEDVLSDEEFIKRTRTIDLQSEEARRLFYANGGGQYRNSSFPLTFANAWDMLRQQKLRNLRKK